MSQDKLRQQRILLLIKIKRIINDGLVLTRFDYKNYCKRGLKSIQNQHVYN